MSVRKPTAVAEYYRRDEKVTFAAITQSTQTPAPDAGSVAVNVTAGKIPATCNVDTGIISIAVGASATCTTAAMPSAPNGCSDAYGDTVDGSVTLETSFTSGDSGVGGLATTSPVGTIDGATLTRTAPGSVTVYFYIYKIGGKLQWQAGEQICNPFQNFVPVGSAVMN